VAWGVLRERMSDRVKGLLLVGVLAGVLVLIAILISPGNAIGLYLGLFVLAAIALLVRSVYRGWKG